MIILLINWKSHKTLEGQFPSSSIDSDWKSNDFFFFFDKESLMTWICISKSVSNNNSVTIPSKVFPTMCFSVGQSLPWNFLTILIIIFWLEVVLIFVFTDYLKWQKFTILFHTILDNSSSGNWSPFEKRTGNLNVCFVWIV